MSLELKLFSVITFFELSAAKAERLSDDTALLKNLHPFQSKEAHGSTIGWGTALQAGR
jgi:hypothetical protein